MLSRERQIPLIILKLQALLRRLPQNHPKRAKIKENLSRWIAGYKGEESLDYYLKYLDSKNYSIFPNVRLLNYLKHAFQMDFLILSASFLLILEVKNISGSLFFDKNSNQVIRTYNNIERGFQNPITQVNRQKEQMKLWLHDKKFASIPIESFVVFSNSSTIVKTNANNQEIYKTIIHSEQLLERIHRLEEKHTYKVFDKKEFRRLEKLVHNEDTAMQQDVLSMYAISEKEIQRGVRCPRCETFRTKRLRGKWSCQYCGEETRDAHLEAIDDYFLLLSSCITNKSCREFLKIDSRHSVKKLLQSTSIRSSGTKKGTIYHSPYE